MAKKDSASKKASSAQGGAKAPRGAARKPAMPAALPDREATRRGGLGRGLASLIPTGPSRPGLGNGAADVILGGGGAGGAAARRATGQDSGDAARGASASGADAGGTDIRHSDVNRPTSSMGENTGAPTQKSASAASGEAHALYAKGAAGSKVAKGGASTKADAPRSRGAKDSSHTKGSTAPQELTELQGSAESQGEAGGPELSNADSFGATYQELPLDAITTNPKQPRSVFDEEQLNELVHSIREFGLMQPIVVRPVSGAPAPYELIMGERRLRASKKAGLETIPAIVRETQDDAMLRDALLENIHRVQLNPLEEAAAYQQLLEEFGVTQEQLAKRIGRSRSLIANMIRLLQLPVVVQRRVSAGVLSAGHARALLALKGGEEAQAQLADRIVAEGLSVRATEEAVTLMNRGEGQKQERKQRTPAPLPDYVNSWVDDFADTLETKVSVQMGKKRGRIVVEFGGQEDFDRIIEILGGGEQ
ncbi:ParB/RepB/Spo0J family partition protein [Corynebacterium urealyticum]|uniref:ParB/RepB/Spo0J family partition protein n=1 Tax=Corynebacterium urealyticum TaxID=43771 RepID=UPI0002B3F671|nr:ParB/RepB/Spo0J family partition protein [Corynebacterium urealyticum]AGE37522.1 chromosome partitioning protein ParB [Corynebacterium urealyticum DSM 7111]QQB07479.1 ParB/RepB/Spo0J family partition protein [Corynebacterium urealyticum]